MTITTDIQKLADKLAATEDDHAAALESDRRKLAELKAKEAVEQAAAEARAAGRRKTWADWFLTTRVGNELADQKRAVREAEAKLAEALADEPWIQALAEAAAARARQDLILADQDQAQEAMGRSVHLRTLDQSVVIPKYEGKLDPSPLLAAIIRAAQPITDAAVAQEREQRAEAVAVHIEGQDTEVDRWLSEQQLARQNDPLTALRAGSSPDRVETVTVPSEDGKPVTRHHNLDTDEVLYLNANGERHVAAPVASFVVPPPAWTR